MEVILDNLRFDLSHINDLLTAFSTNWIQVWFILALILCPFPLICFIVKVRHEVESINHQVSAAAGDQGSKIVCRLSRVTIWVF